MKRRVVAALFVAFTLSTASAHADGTATAEELFQRAKALIASGKWADACPLLKESYRLDPAGGTLQNLAVCYETSGLWASAVARFQELKDISQRATPPRTERIKLADEHLAKLTGKISHLILTLPDDVAATADVQVDGVRYQRVAWSVGITLDPGPHEVAVTAPGKIPFKTSVTTPSEATEQQLAITLETVPPPPPDSGLVDERHSKADEAAKLAREQRDREDAAHASRRMGYFVGGTGVLALGAGMVFGALAIKKNNAGKERCRSGEPAAFFNKQGDCIEQTDPWVEANDLKRTARTFANISNVLTGVGILGIGAGVYLVFVRGRSTASLKIGPTVGGLVAAGTF